MSNPGLSTTKTLLRSVVDGELGSVSYYTVSHLTVKVKVISERQSWLIFILLLWSFSPSIPCLPLVSSAL